MSSQITDCGAANLLAVLFKKPVNEVKKKLGVPIDSPTICSSCGKPISSINRSGVCKKCRTIKLVCPVCGRLFERRAADIVWNLTNNHPQNNKLQQEIFCSRKCNGKMSGTRYGFKAHPENIRSRRVKR